MLWDIRRVKLLRVLGRHLGPVVSVSINGVCGNILTLTASELRLYSINGVLLSSSSICLIGNSRPRALMVLAVPLGDWQDGIIAVTGHEAGFIVVWRYGSNRYAMSGSPKDGTSKEIIGIPLIKTHRSDITILRICNLEKHNLSSNSAVPRVFEGEGGHELLAGDLDGCYSRWAPAQLDEIDPDELQRIFSKEKTHPAIDYSP